MRLASFLQTSTLAGLLWAFSGCGPATTDLSDGPDELMADEASLTSYPGLTEGTPEARGVLRVANESAQATLSSSQGVGIPARTAKSIVAVRSGLDGKEPTADDHPLATLKELYAVKYVGKATIDRLLAYAKAHGFVSLDDPMPSCPGLGRMPTTGDLLFRSGQESFFVRSCDAYGACSPWKVQRAAVSVSSYNGYRSLLLAPDGSVYVQAGLGFTTSTSGSSTYYCKDFDIGSARLDPATGLGTGSMQSGYECDIAGGSGGPYHNDSQRKVDVRFGATCLSITDQDSSGPRYGVEYKRILTLVP